ncbi:MAG: transcription elongation factor GreA [Spirochaetaceae bacterium]|nr:transcription elongation factor GreA [Spirochaetaceae bacterium]
MSDTLLERINGILTEEMWTRQALLDCTVQQFESFELLLNEAYTTGKAAEVKALCDEKIGENKSSVLAMYLSGIIAWERDQLEDADLLTLIAKFSEANKWLIVEYIAQKMLKSGENKVVLRALAKSYEKQDNEPARYLTLERLAKLDYEDTELVTELARYYEAKGNTDEAVSYYKKASYRYINRKLFAGLYEVWQKLLVYCADSDDLFNSLILKAEKTMEPAKVIELQKLLLNHYKEQGKWDLAITTLKKLLNFNSKDSGSRKLLIECYREKYKDSKRYEECLAISNLAQNWKPVQEAIDSFEKHIKLDKNRFVYHRTWGVGRIKEMAEDNVIIDFAKKRGHTMSFEMAVSSLLSLDDNHIWVLKATVPRDKLRERFKKNPALALKVIAASFEGKSDMKKVKAELSPTDSEGILSNSEWSSFSSEARKILKTDSEFGNVASKGDSFTLRTSPASLEEKLSNNFKSETNFFKRIIILEEFLQAAEAGNEYFDDMFNYFFNYLKAPITSEQVVASYLLVQKLLKTTVVSVTLPYSFNDLCSDIDDIEATFAKLESVNLKEDFLQLVLRNLDNWQELFIMLLPQYPSATIINELKRVGRNEEIKKAFSLITERYRLSYEPFFWLAEHVHNSEDRYEIKLEKVAINLIHLLDITARNVTQKRDLAGSKRYYRQLLTILFKNGLLYTVIEEGDEELANRLYGLLSDVNEIDGNYLNELANQIKDKHPNLKLVKTTIRQKSEAAKSSSRAAGPVWATEKSYLEKSAELKNLTEVEIPKNSAEIGEAIKKGDLKENAEYIFGKERQEQLQQEVGRLQKDLGNLRIFEEANVDTKQVSFGTVVTLQITGGKKKEVYTILGPWESNPDKKILSYLAPFAEKLLGAKMGESLAFTLNDRRYKYDVIEITKANF